MRRALIFPVAMGAGMGAMMLWMLHGQLTGEGSMGPAALAIFIGAHVVVAALAVAAALLGARLHPGVRRLLGRVHRPRARHAAMMMGAALLTAAAIHLGFHGWQT